MRKIITNIIFVLSLIIASNRPAAALETPNFPSCLSPQGTLRVFYPNGTHGIVGDPNSYVGSDAVYDLDETTLIQCFCSVDGTGIQTNWWAAASLTESQVQILKNDGWFYVPNGALWGLEASPYVAKNVRYSCLSSGTPTPTPTSSSGGSSSSSGGSSNPSSSPSEGGEVLGLAATGDALVLLTLTILALILIVAGIRESRHEKN